LLILFDMFTHGTSEPPKVGSVNPEIYLVCAYDSLKVRTFQDILVGGLEHEFYFSIYWAKYSQLTISYFSEGYVEHQAIFQVPKLVCNIRNFPSLNIG